MSGLMGGVDEGSMAAEISKLSSVEVAEVDLDDEAVLGKIINNFGMNHFWGYLEVRKGSHDWTKRLVVLSDTAMTRYT